MHGFGRAGVGCACLVSGSRSGVGYLYILQGTGPGFFYARLFVTLKINCTKSNRIRRHAMNSILVVYVYGNPSGLIDTAVVVELGSAIEVGT